MDVRAIAARSVIVLLTDVTKSCPDFFSQQRTSDQEDPPNGGLFIFEDVTRCNLLSVICINRLTQINHFHFQKYLAQVQFHLRVHSGVV